MDDGAAVSCPIIIGDCQLSQLFECLSLAILRVSYIHRQVREMDYKEAKETVESFPSGSKLRIAGYFDFPKLTTDRIGVVVKFDTDALTLDEQDGTDLKVLRYEKIVNIRLDRGMQPPMPRTS